MADEARHKVVIVGGGFGGLPASRYLARKAVDVTLIDRRNHHLFQPLLYQVATGILAPSEISAVLRHVHRRHRSVTVELAEVTSIDLERRLVHTATLPGYDNEYPYDSLIVATGVQQSYFGHDEFALIAPGMKTVDDALELRRRVFGAFELAESATDESDRRLWMTFVIVGAGPTGVELAGQIREIADRTLLKDFRRIKPSDINVILVDGGKEPLATFGDQLSERAAKTLTRMGVELKMGGRVVGIDARGVDVDSTDGKYRIAAHTVIWAAGVQASPLAAQLAEASGAETDRAGRVCALPNLTLPGHPEVFVVGDMVSLNDLPGVAEVAMQGSLHAANTINRRIRGDHRDVPFKYRDVGSVAAIGRFKAIASVKGMRFSGFLGWVVWLFVHLAFLNGFGNRVGAVFRWGKAMIGHSRPERVFSFGHTGGDLSLPPAVKSQVMKNSFPIAAIRDSGTSGDDATGTQMASSA
jgi:NADH:ubiquinone reductase (H+-translocating)